MAEVAAREAAARVVRGRIEVDRMHRAIVTGAMRATTFALGRPRLGGALSGYHCVMKENYRGYVLEYSATARGAPTGGYVLNASPYPPCSRGQVPPMHLEQLSSASSSKEALRHAQAEAQSLVDKAASNTFTNEELAAHQLQRALILFFEDGDYLSAVTLAHAAYIIFVKVGVKPGEPDHREPPHSA